MKVKKQLSELFVKFEPAIRWLTIIASLVTIISFMANLFTGGGFGWLDTVIEFLVAYSATIWLSTVTLAVFLLAIWTWSLYKRFTGVFREDFKGSLAKQWDFEGDWRVTGQNELLVTNSDPGGLTKTGAFWENYNLEFEAKILNKCLGIIVRAQDLNNYYMFQISKDIIRPHRRVTIPVQSSESIISTVMELVLYIMLLMNLNLDGKIVIKKLDGPPWNPQSKLNYTLSFLLLKELSVAIFVILL